MLISDDHMYGLINGFLLLKPSLDVVNVPEFYKLFNSSAMEVNILAVIHLHVPIIPPANFVCRGYTIFTLSVHPSVRPSVRPSDTLCFLNNSKNHCWIFIKPCKHVHICKTNTLDKKVRARGQFY